MNYPPVAASNSAHSHLSRSPQYGQTQTHLSIELPHSTQIAKSSSSLEPIGFSTTEYYKWFEVRMNSWSPKKRKFSLQERFMVLP